MAKNQPIKAIDVVPSDTINIPEPGSYVTGFQILAGPPNTTIIGQGPFKGVSNPGNTGYSNKVEVGDVVYVTDSAGAITIATVTSVDTNFQLTVSTAVPGNPATYAIYRSNGQAHPSLGMNGKAGQEGYSLYVGGAGPANLSVIPAASEDTVILKNVTSGFIPLQVTRVNSTGTTATDILALE